MFASSIFQALSSDQQLAFLIPPANMYFQRIPPGVTMPLLTFFTIGGPEPNWTFEPGYWEEVQFQVSIFTSSPTTTSLAVYRVDNLLCWKPLVFDNTVNMGILRTSPLDNLLLDPEANEADQDVWMTPLLYTARLIRSL